MPELHFLPGRLGSEFSTLKAMVRLYCRAHQHKLKHVGIYCECSECAEFIGYANKKLDSCPYGQHKPTCNKCPIHCYKKVKRLIAIIAMRLNDC